MAKQKYQDLVQLIKKEARNSFRSAWGYDDNGWTTLYVRDDIATKELQGVISELIYEAKENEPIIDPEVYGQLGEIEAEIELHSEAVFLHFPESESKGVIVTLDQEAAKDLAKFIERCNSVLANR